MFNFTTEPAMSDPNPQPLPCGRLDEPTELCILGEWVPEPLLGIVRQRVLDELARLSPGFSLTHLTKAARVTRSQMRQFLAASPRGCRSPSPFLNRSATPSGSPFIDDTFIMVPERLTAEVEKGRCAPKEQVR